MLVSVTCILILLGPVSVSLHVHVQSIGTIEYVRSLPDDRPNGIEIIIGGDVTGGPGVGAGVGAKH